ncbi:MAG: hypothetical protein NNA18_01180 [Nitrospira sp.]|nr:hypothetical protein [Nitrospira sp.]
MLFFVATMRQGFSHRREKPPFSLVVVGWVTAWIAWLTVLEPLAAVSMLNDPGGFHGIRWGSPLSSRNDLELLRASSHITEYRSKTGDTTFAGAEMTSISFVALNDQFARVTIRYEGEAIHKQVLNFLESHYGALQRIPGQMTRGLNQQYTWRGPDTEISLTYQANTQRGFIFIDSRTLAPRFNDDLTDSAE